MPANPAITVLNVAPIVQGSCPSRLFAAISDYWELTKPEVNFLILFTTFVGFYLASTSGAAYRYRKRWIPDLAFAVALAVALSCHSERSEESLILFALFRSGRIAPCPLPFIVGASGRCRSLRPLAFARI